MCEQVAASGNTLILYSACTGHYIVSCSYHSKRTPTTFFLFCPSSPLRYPPSKCSNYVVFFRFLCPLSVSKDMQDIFPCHFIRNALNRQFLVRKGNQCSNRLPLRCCDTFLFRLYLLKCFFKMC